MTSKKLFLILIAASLAVMISIVALQFMRHGMLGTGLLLGMDSPGYVWAAKNVVEYGPVLMIQHWRFTNSYVQLLAFLGCLSGNIVLMETGLPLMFALLLVYANSRCVLEITGSFPAAYLSVFMTTVSINTLRLLSDLHSNLMALSLSFVVLLWYSRSKDDKSVLSKQYLPVIAVFLLIASTHIETYVLLSVTCLLQGLLRRDYRRAAKWFVLSAIPGVVLVPALIAGGFSMSLSSDLTIGSPLTVDEIVLWLGGSVFLYLFLVIGVIYLLHRSIRSGNQLSQLVLLWVFVNLTLASVVESGILPSSNPTSFRLLLAVPVPMLLSLAAFFVVSSTRSVSLSFRILSARKHYPLHLSTQRIAVVAVILLAANMVFVTYEHVDESLTPYMSNSTYLRIGETKKFFEENQLRIPVVVFRGEAAIQLGWVMRTYIGAELGEHFAYYGEFDNLLDLTSLSVTYQDTNENALSKAWSGEMLGIYNTMWVHSSTITSVEGLKSCPLLVISPDLYDGRLPYYMRPFHIGQGIYVIPPDTISKTGKTLYGPSITLFADGLPSQVRSEYLDIDPQDPSVVCVMVNASSGYESYEISGFPSNWIFYGISQGGDLSFPDENPVRFDGAPAVLGNDPAETLDSWSATAVNGTIFLDPINRKEGVSSLRVSGAFDAWGNLGALYEIPGTQNLTLHNSLSVWAKSSEPATFSAALIDSEGNTRIYWSIAAPDGGSSSTEWKRFLIRLNEFSTEEGAFNIGDVDKIFLYTWMAEGPVKNMTLWIDDLTLDTLDNFGTYIRKDRVLMDDSIVFYFREKEPQN